MERADQPAALGTAEISCVARESRGKNGRQVSDAAHSSGVVSRHDPGARNGIFAEFHVLGKH